MFNSALLQRALFSAASLTLFLSMPLQGFAQSASSASGAWPNRPIKMIVPYSPGGSADIDRLNKEVNQLLAQGSFRDAIQSMGGQIAGGTPEQYAAIRHELPGALSIYAFGSRITGGAMPDSDLDLSVLTQGYADPVKLWELASQLTDIAGVNVDLADFRSASTVLQHQILVTGRRLWSLDIQADLFELFVLREKFNLDDARAALMKDIQIRGSVYVK